MKQTTTGGNEMQKQAQILKDTDKFTILKADYGDLDPTSDSTVGLLAGFYLIDKKTDSCNHVGDTLLDAVKWIQQAQAIADQS
jgi:hypothetical protein